MVAVSLSGVELGRLGGRISVAQFYAPPPTNACYLVDAYELSKQNKRELQAFFSKILESEKVAQYLRAITLGRNLL